MCAKRFKNKGVEYEELYSAACLGLLKARQGFDESFGVKFSTYAVPVVLGEIKRIFRDGGTVKASRSIKELSLRITRLREDYLRRQGREPDVAELCEKTGEQADKICEAICASLPPLSLTVGEDAPAELDLPVPPPDRKIVELLSLRSALLHLEKTDRRLLYLRYFKGLTQVKIAEILGITQVQVSRKEKKLLEKLRAELS